ncbi:MAG: hypothetical protein HYZ44_10335 [Bacteroidetes bacterium]|nr:hypothetical protein [Bacteroidota bacterium]
MTDASRFSGSRSEFVTREFDAIISLFSFCCEKMNKQKPLIGGADEEWIRNIFVAKFVRKQKNKFGLGHLLFLAEVAEIDSQTLKTSGYIDITVHNIRQNSLKGNNIKANENEYYAFECKRVKSESKSSAFREYASQGIARFISGKYSAKMNLAGMIGFVEEKKIKIVALQTAIDEVLKHEMKSSTVSSLASHSINGISSPCYISTHRRQSSSNIKLFHLFLDITAAFN